MYGAIRAHDHQRDQHKQNQNESDKMAIATTCDFMLERIAMGEHDHTASDWCVCTKGTVSQLTCCEMQHRCKSLNKRRLRTSHESIRNLRPINVELEWAFCRSLVGEMPQAALLI